MKLTFLILLSLLFLGCSDDVSYNTIDEAEISKPPLTTNPSTLDETDTTVPVFTSPTEVIIDENQLEVLTVKATDEHNVTYTLSGEDSNLLNIGHSNGLIQFRYYADYEYKSLYKVIIKANDGSNTAEQNLSIVLNNINDNAPSINISSMLNVAENSLFIANYTTSDADNDTLSVSLSGVDLSYFALNTAQNTLVFRNPLNYENNKHIYNINIVVSDGPHKSTYPLQIQLSNIADLGAVLSTFTVQINENIPLNTYIGQIHTVIGDSNIISFELNGTNSNNFFINTSGQIYTTKTMDYETSPEYNLTLYAVDATGKSNTVDVHISVKDIVEQEVPLLVIVMNWSNYSESDAAIWNKKFFDHTQNSVATWYAESTNGEISLIPVSESSGTPNDGIIFINMAIPHPGNDNPTVFRDTHVYNAIRSPEVSSAIDFSLYDTNNDGFVSAKELQFIFIVAGGEASYGDPYDHSIWASAWSFGSPSDLVDGVSIMTYAGDPGKDGSFARFGANQGNHKATIGVIVHEMGHALLNLPDLYDPNHLSSGLGYYDVMSGGAWAKASLNELDGQTPTQFSDLSKTVGELDNNITVVTTTSTLTIKCSHKDIIKLPTVDNKIFFLMSCRDSAKSYSDISFKQARDKYYNTNPSFENRLFMTLYHVDISEDVNGYIHSNSESGVQSVNNHYMVSLHEQDQTDPMTSTQWIDANYKDIYTTGDTIQESDLNNYDGTPTGYSLEVLSEDYNKRTMTVKIIK